jgi:hypothetical protein
LGNGCSTARAGLSPALSQSNMIDSTLRAELSQDIRRLATGQMTNDEFDDRYYEVYQPSDDDAITSIATYCYWLYSSDLLFPMRLRGRYAPKSGNTARCRAPLSRRQHSFCPTIQNCKPETADHSIKSLIRSQVPDIIHFLIAATLSDRLHGCGLQSLD